MRDSRLPTLAVLAAALSTAGFTGPPGEVLAPARAAAGPGFSDPLSITNAWFPVDPGTVHVYAGREGRDRITVVERHLEETRTFSWQGGDVPCRIVLETKFENGVRTEASRSFFAQGDDGGVWYFGEIPVPVPPPDEDGEDGSPDAESTGWVVGLRSPEDPPETAEGASPTLFMPASPAAGDVWKPEDLYPVVDETDEAVRTGVRLRTPSGLFSGCLEVRERSALDDGTETKWYAPGVGVVLARARGEGLRLQASTALRR